MKVCWFALLNEELLFINLSFSFVWGPLGLIRLINVFVSSGVGCCDVLLWYVVSLSLMKKVFILYMYIKWHKWKWKNSSNVDENFYDIVKWNKLNSLQQENRQENKEHGRQLGMTRQHCQINLSCKNKDQSTLIDCSLILQLFFCFCPVRGSQQALDMPQDVQNSAARVLTPNLPSNITPTLKHLNWLSVKFCITYKLLLLIYKSLHALGPQYSVLLHEHTPLWNPRSSLHPPHRYYYIPNLCANGLG